MSLKFEDDQGVWRTIGGRKVFIREGQSLSSAMKQSGKFKKSEKQKYYEGQYEKALNDIKGLDRRDAVEIVNKELDNGNITQTEARRLQNEIDKSEKSIIHQTPEEAKAKLDKARNEQQKAQDEWDNHLKNIQKEKTLSDLNKERDAKFKEIVGANTKRQDIYKDAGSDEAYKNLYGKEPEKNAKNQLSDSDYKKYEELTNQYHSGRKDLAKIDKQIEEFRKTHPKEETKKASGKFWEEAEKERQQIKENASKAGKSVEEYEKQKTKELFGKENDETSKYLKQRNEEARYEKALDEYKGGKNYNEPTKNSGNDYLPKENEIKEQGKSNRKEVSDNIQAHILSYYDNPVDFMEQMDAMDYLPTKWRQGEEIAKGGSYLIYNDDMSDYLDSLKINPKGKKFSEDKAFNMYTSLVGRESEHLYNRLEKLFEQYKQEHKNSNVSLDDFRKWFK